MTRLRMAEVNSRTRGSKTKYVVCMVREDSQWQCSCPGWTRRTPRTDCTHIQGCKLESAGMTGNLKITWTSHGKKWVKEQIDAMPDLGAKARAAERKKLTRKAVAGGKLAVARFASLEVDD